MAELYDRVLDGVVAKLSAIAGVTVKRQRFPELMNRPANTVVVSYYGEIEQIGGGDWAADEIGLPVLVQYFGSQVNTQDDATQERELTVRGLIYDALAYKRLTAVPEVQTVVPEPRAVAEREVKPVDSSTTEVVQSGILFRVIARRTRAA